MINPVVLTKTSAELGIDCAYCKKPLSAGDTVVSCPLDEVKHHSHCWSENGAKCSSFGCEGSGELYTLSADSLQKDQSFKSTPPSAKESSRKNQNRPSSKPSRISKLIEGTTYGILWIGLAVIGAALAYVIFRTIMIGGVWLNESPYRPLYWSSFRLKWLARFVALALGISYVFYVSLLENLLTNWQSRNNLLKGALRHAGALIVVMLSFMSVAAVLLWVL